MRVRPGAEGPRLVFKQSYTNAHTQWEHTEEETSDMLSIAVTAVTLRVKTED